MEWPLDIEQDCGGTRRVWPGAEFFRVVMVGLFLLITSPGTILGDGNVAAWLNDTRLNELVAIYQEFHQSPELSLQEERTAAKFGGYLKKFPGIEVHSRIGGHGIVGMLKNGPGKTLLLRADLDALPVTEMTALAYASKIKAKDSEGNEVGVMHACGHDIHMTNLLGVARYLAGHRDMWSGTVLFVGQPAEERGAGAKKMLDDKLFSRFGKPDFAIALHVDSTLATGHVGYRSGYSLANVDSIDITVFGRGGHGAYPHTTIDPIVQAAHLIIDLQTIVSRETNPIDPAVVTVGAIHAGSKHNIIPGECKLQLTVRSYGDQTRKKILEAIDRKAKAVALSFRAPEPKIVISEGTPALFNNEALVQQLRGVFEKAVGSDHVVQSDPSMGGEDFSEFGVAGVPICMYRLGSVKHDRLEKLKSGGKLPPSLHSPLYYPDPPETLRTGIISMVAVVRELLSPPSQSSK